MMVLQKLRAAGCFVEIIATPKTFFGGKPRYLAKVFGDIIGLNADGRGLLVECKNVSNRKGQPRPPTPSDFRPEQVRNLQRWHEMGGVALIGFIEGAQIKILPAAYVLGIRSTLAAQVYLA